MNELFDPKHGSVVASAPGSGPGWWAGAPGGYVVPETGIAYLTYRIRRPRGVEPDRGGQCVLACSEDGAEFHPVWSMTKDQLSSPSLERSAIHRLPDGRWILFISYVDGNTNQWRTDRLIADDPTEFSVGRREKLFTAEEIGLSAVKDPVVIEQEGSFYMLLSCAVASGARPADHSTADAFDTGTVLGHTGLATSDDGIHFRWQGLVLRASGGERWDAYSARIAAVLRVGEYWIGFYDGARGVENHYDEPTGLAVSTDFSRWRRVGDGPALAAGGERCLRYVAILERGAEAVVFYEYGREDGSHELRRLAMPLGELKRRLAIYL